MLIGRVEEGGVKAGPLVAKLFGGRLPWPSCPWAQVRDGPLAVWRRRDRGILTSRYRSVSSKKLEICANGILTSRYWSVTSKELEICAMELWQYLRRCVRLARNIYIYTVYIRFYGRNITNMRSYTCIYTALANPTDEPSNNSAHCLAVGVDVTVHYRHSHPKFMQTHS